MPRKRSERQVGPQNRPASESRDVYDCTGSNSRATTNKDNINKVVVKNDNSRKVNNGVINNDTMGLCNAITFTKTALINNFHFIKCSRNIEDTVSLSCLIDTGATVSVINREV